AGADRRDGCPARPGVRRGHARGRIPQEVLARDVAAHRADERPGERMTPPGLRARIRRFLTRETTGGVLLLGAAAAALVWANSPWASGYRALSETVVGPAAIHLDLSLATWAADGLLAIFFFTVGV